MRSFMIKPPPRGTFCLGRPAEQLQPHRPRTKRAERLTAARWHDAMEASRV
jgi:uncharacterized protein (DUF2237 family)